MTPIVGTAPVNWNNDDLEDWRPVVPLQTMLDEMASAGYAGTEYGGTFPRDSLEVRRELDARSLRLAGSYQWLHLRDSERLSQELQALDSTFATLVEAGSRDLIVADAMTPERIAIAGQVSLDGSDGLDDGGWQRLGAGLDQAGEAASRHGLTVHYHNHVGSFVESPAEVERLLTEIAGIPVDLCFDTGHYAYGGGDPTSFVVEHGDRIGYLHLKDVDGAVLTNARQRRLSFLEALREYIFSDLGTGIVDIPKVIGALRTASYAGWIIVEQDTCRGPAIESAVANRQYLQVECGI